MKIINYESYLDEEKLNRLMMMLNSTLNINGNIIECRCARVGTTIIMANYIKKMNISKKIYACDSFGEGFDPNELKNDIRKGFTSVDNLAFTHDCYNYVKKKIKNLKLSDTIILMKDFSIIF